MKKYMVLRLSLIAWRILGIVIALGSLGASLLILTANVQWRLLAAVAIVIVGIFTGWLMLALADYFDATLDTAENTSYISDQLDWLIRRKPQ